MKRKKRFITFWNFFVLFVHFYLRPMKNLTDPLKCFWKTRLHQLCNSLKGMHFSNFFFFLIHPKKRLSWLSINFLRLWDVSFVPFFCLCQFLHLSVTVPHFCFLFEFLKRIQVLRQNMKSGCKGSVSLNLNVIYVDNLWNKWMCLSIWLRL